MSNTDTDKYILIAKIGSPYGLQGWLKIQTFTAHDENILEYFPWYSKDARTEVMSELKIEEGKPHGDGIIAKFPGHDTPESAKKLTGKEIYIKRSQLPELSADEYYWSDLIGLTVVNLQGETLGTIVHLMETGSNDVIVVKGEKEIAIPYLPGTVVKNIDLSKKEMVVDWEPV